jgi:hypothetical protein
MRRTAPATRNTPSRRLPRGFLAFLILIVLNAIWWSISG